MSEKVISRVGSAERNQYLPGDQPLPVGGWLIVLGSFLCFSLVAQCFLLYRFMISSLFYFWQFFNEQTISASYDMQFKFFILSLPLPIVMLGSFLAQSYLVVLFFRGKLKFRVLFNIVFIGILIVNILVRIVKGILAYLWFFNPAALTFGLSDFLTMFRFPKLVGWLQIMIAVAALLLWGLYLQKSKRVKATFVKP